jgi:hypothetical protein
VPACSRSTSCSKQLDFSPARRAVEIAGERDVLAAAIYDAITDTIEDLSLRCRDYWNGNADIDAIATTNNTLRGLLRLIEIDATAPSRAAAL